MGVLWEFYGVSLGVLLRVLLVVLLGLLGDSWETLGTLFVGSWGFLRALEHNVEGHTDRLTRFAFLGSQKQGDARVTGQHSHSHHFK